MIYRHYSRYENKQSEFDKTLFNDIKNREGFNKPHGGYWASPIECEYSWHDWCKDEQPEWILGENNYFDFELKDDARVLKLSTIEDVKTFIGNNEYYLCRNIENLKLIRYFSETSIINYSHPHFMIPMLMLDFERLKDNYDAIEITIDELYDIMYGWDCDSILVMNPEVIVPCKK